MVEHKKKVEGFDAKILKLNTELDSLVTFEEANKRFNKQSQLTGKKKYLKASLNALTTENNEAKESTETL